MKKLLSIVALLMSFNAVWALDGTESLDLVSLGDNEDVSISADEQDNQHESGCWVLLRDRFNREVWYQMEHYDYDEDFDFVTSIYLGYSLFGGFDPETTEWDDIPKVPLWIVFDGIKYGAQSPEEEPVFGYPEENLLIVNDNSYELRVGYRYVIGFSHDVETGDLFLIVSQGVWPDNYNPYNPADYITGDVDWNAKVNIDDVTTLINHLLSGNVTPFNSANADVDGSGLICIDDVTLLINYLLNGRW